MKRFVLALVLVVCGCSGGAVRINDYIVGRQLEAAEATLKKLNRNEVVHSVVRRPFSSRPASDAHYIVRAASRNESRGGRWFLVLESGGEWRVLRKSGRWVRFEQPHSGRDIRLQAPVEIGDAIEILELVKAGLDEDEYIHFLGSCAGEEETTDSFEEPELWRRGESGLCVEARVYRGIETVGRRVKLTFEDGSFTVVR